MKGYVENKEAVRMGRLACGGLTNEKQVYGSWVVDIISEV